MRSYGDGAPPVNYLANLFVYVSVDLTPARIYSYSCRTPLNGRIVVIDQDQINDPSKPFRWPVEKLYSEPEKLPFQKFTPCPNGRHERDSSKDMNARPAAQTGALYVVPVPGQEMTFGLSIRHTFAIVSKSLTGR